MTTERIDVIVSEKGARVVERNIAAIGGAASKSASPVQALQRLLTRHQDRVPGAGRRHRDAVVVNEWRYDQVSPPGERLTQRRLGSCAAKTVGVKPRFLDFWRGFPHDAPQLVCQVAYLVVSVLGKCAHAHVRQSTH